MSAGRNWSAMDDIAAAIEAGDQETACALACALAKGEALEVKEENPVEEEN